MRVTILVAALVLLASCSLAQNWSNAEKEILTLQDQRSLGGGKLLLYLKNPDPHLRYRALIALANIQDRSVDSAFAAAMSDSSAVVRAAAAFALGQIGEQRNHAALLEHLRQESDTVVISRVLEAL